MVVPCILPLLLMTQLSHGLVGGEKDKFYEDLEVRASCLPHGHTVGERQGSQMFNVSFVVSRKFHVLSTARTLAPARKLL